MCGTMHTKTDKKYIEETILKFDKVLNYIENTVKANEASNTY